MVLLVQWSGLYLQLSSLNFLMSGLFGDILCLRFFLTFAYLFLFINAVTGFPPLGELVTGPHEVFILHWDVLAWSTVTLYVHFSKFMGILLNEKEIDLPEESLPLWRMLYRNGGLSQLLFKQFIYPQKFQLVNFKAGSQIPTDNCLYIILDGVADTTITLQRGDGYSEIASAKSPTIPSPKAMSGNDTTKQSGTPYSQKKKHFQKMSSTSSTTTHRNLALTSGDIINIKCLQLFRDGSESEAFANQTVNATALTDMTMYRIRDVDIKSMAQTPQTKNAYQGLLIFALTGVAEKEIMVRHFAECGDYSDYNTHRDLGPDGRDYAFQPLEDWEEPDPLVSGSGKALTMPVRHFLRALESSYRPPWPIIRWIPGLRHAALPAPHLCPPEDKLLTRKDTISSLTNEFGEPVTETTPAVAAVNYGSTDSNDVTPLMANDPSGMEVENGSAEQHGGRGGFWFFGKK